MNDMNVRFPSKLQDQDPYFVQFGFYSLEAIELSIRQDSSGSGGLLSSISNVNAAFDYSTLADELVGTIQLPVQQSIPEETNISFSDKSIRDQTVTSSIASSVLSGNGVTRDQLEGFVESMTPEGGVMEIARDIANLSGNQRKAINQQMQLFFDKPERRNYPFEFQLVARNKGDAEAMQKIRKLLHYHANPGLSSTDGPASFFTYPSMVRFSFHRITSENGSEPVESLYESKYCYITSVNVTHGNEGYQQFTDGEYSNTGIMKISLQLQEAELFTREDYREGEQENV